MYMTPGFGTVTPYLFADDADRLVRFVRDAFGAEESLRSLRPRALHRGAVHVMDVQDTPYGDRRGGVRDPAGNLWWISQRLVNAPYSAQD